MQNNKALICAYPDGNFSFRSGDKVKFCTDADEVGAELEEMLWPLVAPFLEKRQDIEIIVKPLAALTEKEIAIRNVIVRRCKIVREKILPNVKEKKMAEYYAGKIDGLRQAYELLGESIESIKIEL